MKSHVFLLGGGTRLAAHLGVLRAIEEQFGPIAAWAGASAGSLVAAVRASGFNHEMAVDLMMDTNYRQFFDIRPLGLIRGYGLCSGKKFEKWLDGVLCGICFEDLDVPLAIVCSDVETGEPYIFSKEKTPKIKVATSVRCSISIPGVFAIRPVNGDILIDGSLAKVDPTMLFPTDHAPSIVVRMLRDRVAKLMNRRGFGFSTYVQRVADMILDATEDRISPELWTHDVLIRTGHHSPVNFDIAEDGRRKLYQLGYEQCLQHLGPQVDVRSEQDDDEVPGPQLVREDGPPELKISYLENHA